MVERQPAIIYVAYDGYNCVLVEKRTDPESDGYNQYIFPGGKREADETSPQAAIRELKEETGLAACGLALIDQFQKTTSRGNNYDFDVFLVYPLEGELQDPESKNERLWATFEEAADLLEDPSAQSILEKIKLVLGKI